MAKRRITIEDKSIIEKLQKIKRKGANQQERERSQAILFSNTGMDVKEISQIMDVERRTLYNWFNAYEERGLKSLTRQKGAGRKSLLNREAHKDVVTKYIERYPHQPKKAYALVLKELDISASYKTFHRFLKKYFA